MVCPITYSDHKKIKPGLVASYDIWPGNGEGLFYFQCFINMSLTYILTHLLTAPDPHGTLLRLLVSVKNLCASCLPCSDAVGWAAGRASGL